MSAVATPPAGTDERRLLRDAGRDGGPPTLAEHRSRYRRPPVPARRPQRALIEVVAEAGLRGRGGAGFPTARKLEAVAGRRGPRIVIANATEGEPASSKDRALVNHAPHLVLDGAALAAAAVGASQIIVCIDRADRRAVRSLRSAIAERTGEGGAAVELAETPTRYVAGEETALVRFLNGGDAKPTHVPPRPFEKGVDGRPTLIQNVETLAHVAQIGSFGAAWFRQTGTPDEPGTTLVTVTGAIARPAVVEVPVGTQVRRILARAGGPAEPLAALLAGGFSGTWIPVVAGGAAAFSRTGLSQLGASPGAGILVALPAGACGLVETARILRWFAAESAGQCGPCVFGLADIARTTAAIATGRAATGDVERLRRWAGQIERRGACRHPDGAVRLLRSALDVFAPDLDRHLGGSPCAAARGPGRLAVPETVPGWR
jgi:NADH:ubiquinone oxidoreductase subunit F (NADH-binding)